MKKLMLVFGCLVVSQCRGCEMSTKKIQQPSTMFYYKYLKSVVSMNEVSGIVRDSCRSEMATPFKHYELCDENKCMFMEIQQMMKDDEECPVPSPKKKTPSPVTERSDGFDEDDVVGAFVIHRESK